MQAADDDPAALSRRVRIYQLFVRLFGNTNATRKPNGTLAENGVGKFADINDAALDSLREMGFTHLWLTGVMQQATSTAYPAIGRPADDPDLLKGLAGSPYAIKIISTYARITPRTRHIGWMNLEHCFLGFMRMA